MIDIAYTGIFHFIGGLIAAWGAWRSWQNYKVTKSSYYGLFLRIGAGVSISMFLYSIYTFPEFRDREFLQFAWLVGVPIMYWSFVHAVYFTFKAIQRETLGLFLVVLLIIAIFLLIVASLIWPPQSYVAEGIVVWNPQYPMNIIHPILMTLAMLPVTILFLWRADYTPRTLKSLLLGLAFLLSSGGGAMAARLTDLTALHYALLTMLVGFLLFGAAFLIYPREESSSDSTSIPPSIVS